MAVDRTRRGNGAPAPRFNPTGYPIRESSSSIINQTSLQTSSSQYLANARQRNSNTAPLSTTHSFTPMFGAEPGRMTSVPSQVYPITRRSKASSETPILWNTRDDSSLPISSWSQNRASASRTLPLSATVIDEEEEGLENVFGRALNLGSKESSVSISALEHVPSNPSLDIQSVETGRVICDQTFCPNPTAAKLRSIMQNVKTFFEENFNLNGIDDLGTMPCLSTDWETKNAVSMCHDRNHCELRFHNQYATQVEVVAHEFTHSIVSSFNSLDNTPEAQALNESVADVFGLTFKFWLNPYLRPQLSIVGRNLEVFAHNSQFDPHKDCHDNSVIPSHAFYLAVTSLENQMRAILSPMRAILSPQQRFDIWREVASIWMKVLQEEANIESFAEFALKTLEVAKREGHASCVVEAIEEAWIKVGMLKRLLDLEENEY